MIVYRWIIMEKLIEISFNEFEVLCMDKTKIKLLLSCHTVCWNWIFLLGLFFSIYAFHLTRSKDWWERFVVINRICVFFFFVHCSFLFLFFALTVANVCIWIKSGVHLGLMEFLLKSLKKIDVKKYFAFTPSIP